MLDGLFYINIDAMNETNVIIQSAQIKCNRTNERTKKKKLRNSKRPA